MNDDDDFYMTEDDQTAELAGIDIGIAIGKHETYKEVAAAHAEGKIEFWLEKHRPKTMEEWAEWDANNPEEKL